MTLFSQRKGIKPITKAFQFESMDQDLRNCLWNGLQIALWDRWSPCDNWGVQSEDGKRVELVVKLIWLSYFKRPVDTMPGFDPRIPPTAFAVIREHFFKGEWWEVYDLIEVLVKGVPDDWKDRVKEILNSFLKAENAAYRIVNDEVVEITNDHEIEAIETALEKSVRAVKLHLSRALELLSDRKQPDYRNSIKESISAVEAACQFLTGMPKATLSDCIKVVKSQGAIHPAFEQALLKLYGYTSDEGGIRHALTNNNISPTYADAKFMMVASSAFANFLWTKLSELAIQIHKE
jgi:hypothetical protein